MADASQSITLTSRASTTLLGIGHLYLPDHPRRVSRHDDEVWNVFRYHAAGADCDPLPDGHARKHNDVAAKPAVLANLDGLSALGAPGPVSLEGIQRMVSAIERAVWANEGTRPNLDEACVYPSAASVDVDSFS